MLEAQAETTPPQPHQAEAIDLAHDVSDQKQGDYSDINTLETALASLLLRYPEAPVIAAGVDGVVVAMPASVPLRRNPVLEARTGMDLVSPPDRGRLLSSWDKVLTSGVARCELHLASNPDATVMCSWFDVRENHGVIVIVLVPTDAANGPVPRVPERPPVTSRFGRISKDDAGVIVKIDPGVTQILGWSAEEMEGHRSTEFFHPDDHALAIDNWLEMLASPGIGRRVRLRHRRRDGSWLWFEVTNNNLLEDPDYRCVVCEVVDISEEMAREQFLGRLTETVPVGLFQVDADRRIVYTNDQLHEILGVEPAATVETQLATVVEADHSKLEHALDDVLGQGQAADIEVELQLPPSGRLRFCTISLRALNHGDGTISGAIACVADVTDSTRMREELKKRATFDELTGCYNRPSILDALEASVASGQRRGERAVMFVDLDCFKEVNDREGHAAGDELLRLVAERLRSVVRADDLVGRIGGDEFLIVCPEIGGPDQAMKLAGRIAQALREELCLATLTTTHHVQASIGVAWSNGGGTGADVLVARADGAMYASKRERAGEPRLATSNHEARAEAC
jgi:diguanylate cyclase (GGDEF)-like protein/PAS domain S-box-containing protein